MSELTEAGYQTIRNYVNNNWTHIEIYDDGGNAVTRVDITGDSRSQWLDLDGDNVLKVEFDVTGSDSDISLPVTLQKSAIWDSGSGGNQTTVKEQYANATLNQDGDNVTITHTIKIPQ